MHKLVVSVRKELQLLRRDLGGLAMLFLMPALLIIIITLIQDSTYKTAGVTTLPVILVDDDGGEVAALIRSKLSESPMLSIVSRYQDQVIDAPLARELVQEGQFQIALVIPAGLSVSINKKVEENVSRIVEAFSGAAPSASEARPVNMAPVNMTIYFDPAAGPAFRNSVKNNIEKMLYRVETQKIYSVFREELGLEGELGLLDNELIQFREELPRKGEEGMIVPDAVQHNVPAWILFGIFFIVVPLSVNMVKEKNLGTYIRLRVSPVPYFIYLTGKMITYAVICLLQFGLMIFIARYLFPVLGLQAFFPGPKWPLLTVIAFFSGLAAIGLGLLIGAVANTQEQSAPFGAILVVLLAALGGVWVPVFIMPDIMQKIAVLSPMNWGIEAYYEVILRNGGPADVTSWVLYLFLFFLLTLFLAVGYDKSKRIV